jgi:hypothetical protein
VSLDFIVTSFFGSFTYSGAGDGGGVLPTPPPSPTRTTQYGDQCTAPASPEDEFGFNQV